MENNEDNHAEGSRSTEHHSDSGSIRPSMSLQKQLDLSNEAFLMEEQMHIELEEAEKRVAELCERLRFICESWQPADRGDNPTYTWVLAENRALCSEMQDLMKEVCSLGKFPIEGVCTPSDLTKIA